MSSKSKSSDNLLYIGVAFSFLVVAFMTERHGESLNDVIARKSLPSHIALADNGNPTVNP